MKEQGLKKVLGFEKDIRPNVVRKFLPDVCIWWGFFYRAGIFS